MKAAIKKNLKEFNELLEADTNEAYQEYVKVQKNYASVLNKFIKQKIVKNNNFSELYDASAEFCVENQQEMYWAWLEDENNQIKVLKSIISFHEDELLNPSEFYEESSI